MRGSFTSRVSEVDLNAAERGRMLSGDFDDVLKVRRGRERRERIRMKVQIRSVLRINPAWNFKIHGWNQIVNRQRMNRCPRGYPLSQSA